MFSTSAPSTRARLPSAPFSSAPSAVAVKNRFTSAAELPRIEPPLVVPALLEPDCEISDPLLLPNAR